MRGTGEIRICVLSALRHGDEAYMPELRPRGGARLGELSGMRFEAARAYVLPARGIALAQFARNFLRRVGSAESL